MVLTFLTGVVYPLLVTGLAKALFPWKSGGSMIRQWPCRRQLIGQKFTRPEYFHGRPRPPATWLRWPGVGRLESGADEPEARRSRAGGREEIPRGEPGVYRPDSRRTW